MNVQGETSSTIAVVSLVDDEIESNEELSHLDIILTKLGRKFNKFQIKTCIFLLIPAIISCSFTAPYVFTARELNYRCYVPECENNTVSPQYKPEWLKNAVPYKENEPSRCSKYVYVRSNDTEQEDDYEDDEQKCSANDFDQTVVQTCNDFIFETKEKTILNDFHLMCDENVWKLTIVGTINGFGYFLGLPLAGYISDRFGRRIIMLGGLVFASIMGVARSFAPSYLWYLGLEFLEPAFGSGVYATSFILGLETVAPSKRALMSTMISMCCAIGEALCGLVAWATQSWRLLLRCLYTPGIIMIGFFWLTPESLTWLLSKGRYEEVKDVLRKAARMNKVEITEEELKALECEPQEGNEEKNQYPIKDVFLSRVLLLRLLNCFYCWVACNFVFYGLSLNSVMIAGNAYVNFIAVSLIEMPAYVCTYLMLNRLGRRLSLFGSLLLSAFACVAFIFIPEDMYWIRLSMYLFGKFGITIAYSVLYVLTTEMFPTSLRNSILSACALMGNVGSMPAPQVPLLSEIMKSLPLILFGSLSFSSGLLVLLFPETMNKKLPDTIEEAKNLSNATETTS